MATAYPCAPCQRALIQESRALTSHPSPLAPNLAPHLTSSPCPKQPLYMMSQAQSHAEQLNFYIPIQKTRPDKSGLALVASQPQTLSFASCSAWRSA